MQDLNYPDLLKCYMNNAYRHQCNFNIMLLAASSYCSQSYRHQWDLWCGYNNQVYQLILSVTFKLLTGAAPQIITNKLNRTFYSLSFRLRCWVILVLLSAALLQTAGFEVCSFGSMFSLLQAHWSDQPIAIAGFLWSWMQTLINRQGFKLSGKIT